MIRKVDFSEFSQLNESRINQKFCDVNIRVGDRTFPCHRIILSTTMEYFRSMLGGDYIEGENQEIRLNDVNADDFEQLLNFVYGDSVPVCESNVLRLLVLANYLGMRSMEDACIENVVENNARFSFFSVMNIFRFACTRKITTVIDVLLKPMAENFAHMATFKRLYRIPGSVLLKILTHPNLVRDITAISNFLKKWTELQSDEEKKLLPEILSVLKVEGELKDWVLETLLNSNGTITYAQNTEQDECGDDSDQEFLTNIRGDEIEKDIKVPFLLFTHNSNKMTKTLFVHEFLSTNEITKSAHQHVAKQAHFESKLFFINDTQVIIFSHLSSENESHTFTLCVKNTLGSDSSKKLGTFKGAKFQQSIEDDESKHIFTAAVHGSHIYIYDNFEFFMYAFEQNNWFRVDGYKNVFAPSMSLLNSCLYMAGGLDFSCQYPITSSQTSSMLRSGLPDDSNGRLFKRYDVREGKWSQLPCMKYTRCRAASCVYNDTIYVSGGDHLTYYDNSNVEYYDTRAGKWNELSIPMPKAKMGHSFVAYEDHLWFFGGQIPNSQEFDLTWFSFNMRKNTWSEIFSLPRALDESTIVRILDVHPAVNYKI